MFKHLLRAGALFFVASALLVATAGANSIDFYGNTAGGSVSFIPGFGNSLSVTGAIINTIEFQVPTTTYLPVTGGLLSMVTGPCTGYCSSNMIGVNTNSTDIFGNGGWLEITGSIPGLAGPPSGILFYGTFDANAGSTSFGHPSPCPSTVSLHTDSGQTSGFSGCILPEIINTQLLTDLGFPSNATAGQSYLQELYLDITYSTLDGFSGEVASTDFTVDPRPRVPEPASLALLGAGLLALGSLGRKRLLRK